MLPRDARPVDFISRIDRLPLAFACQGNTRWRQPQLHSPGPPAAFQPVLGPSMFRASRPTTNEAGLGVPFWEYRERPDPIQQLPPAALAKHRPRPPNQRPTGLHVRRVRRNLRRFGQKAPFSPWFRGLFAYCPLRVPERATSDFYLTGRTRGIALGCMPQPFACIQREMGEWRSLTTTKS